MKNYRLGETRTVQIRRILPMGLEVTTGNGQRGLIREREISWNREIQRQFRVRFHPGESYEAVVLSKNADQLELSLRLVEYDPWKQMKGKYEVGFWLSGTVTGIDGANAFVQLEAGITGRLHRSALPDFLNGPIEEQLWIGDHVRVMIVDIRPAQREIELSMRDVVSHRWPENNLNTEKDTAALLQPAAQTALSDNEMGAEPSDIAPRSILVVEDDPNQNRALVGWLRSAGHLVDSAPNVERAQLLLQEAHFEMIFSDVGLPDGSGIELIKTALSQLDFAKCVLMTDWATADHHSAEIAELEAQGVVLLLKPASPEDIYATFSTAGQPIEPNMADPAATDAATGSKPPPGEIAPPAQENGRTKRSISRVMKELKLATDGFSVLLFRLDPYRRQIEIVAASGIRKIDDHVLTDLIYSPVRDAAEDHRQVIIRDVDEERGYARYLRPLLRFRSCLGVPVAANLDSKYALFVFYRQPNPIAQHSIQYAQLAALSVAALLENEATQARFVQLQQTSLIGHLARGLVHETTHHLGPAMFGLATMMKRGQELEAQVKDVPDEAHSQIQEINEELRILYQSLNELSNTTRLFGRVTIQDELQIVRMDRVVARCIELVADTAKRAHVHCQFYEPEQIHVTRARQTQIQQIVLNILLNGIQQIERIYPQTGGQIRIGIETQIDNEQTMIAIDIEDNGPGIHRRLWKRIFDLGMTTRAGEGSGMGLYVAELLATDLGGHIKVEESYIGWGTRFLVRIPVRI